MVYSESVEELQLELQVLGDEGVQFRVGRPADCCHRGHDCFVLAVQHVEEHLHDPVLLLFFLKPMRDPEDQFDACAFHLDIRVVHQFQDLLYIHYE